MNLLLDTHILIWWLVNNEQLSKKTVELIQKADIVTISVASIWEIAIKTSIKKWI